MADIKLYLGCGPLPIHPQHYQFIDDSWVISDKYTTGTNVKNIDATDLSEFADNSISKIYHSHLWEHLSYKESEVALKEWFRVLKSGGTLTVNVPDMEWAARELVRLVDMQMPKSPVFDTQKKLMEVIYGNQDHVGEFHKTGFTKDVLEETLADMGFVNIKIEKVYEAHEMGILLAIAEKP